MNGMAVLHSFTPLPPPINSFSISLAFPEQFTTWHPIILGGGRGKVRLSRLLESRYDVYFHQQPRQTRKKSGGLMNQGNKRLQKVMIKLTTTSVSLKKKTISNFLFLLCCLVVCFFYFTVLINWRAQHPGLKLFLCFLVSSVPVRTEISEVRIEPRT